MSWSDEDTEIIHRTVAGAVREATGSFKAPKIDWMKIGLGVFALLSALFAGTSYLFVTDKQFTAHTTEYEVDKRAQELFNAQFQRNQLEIKEALKGKVDKP